MLEIPLVSALSTGHHEAEIIAVTDPHLGLPSSPENTTVAVKGTGILRQLGISNSPPVPPPSLEPVRPGECQEHSLTKKSESLSDTNTMKET